MRSIIQNDTVQIEITNSCINRCANCTRFVGHTKPFMMNLDTFKNAIDSMKDFPKMVGIMGGEPLLHPEFEDMCKYALSKIPRMQLGLWTCLPKGYEKYREVIVETFGNIFINDHTRTDVFHHPFLVAAEEVIPNRNTMFMAIDRCFFQENWSPSINPRGAYFCEMAASFAMLFPDMGDGWKVEPEWWTKTVKDYTSQIEEFCPRCGGALCLSRKPSDRQAGIDDISPLNYERLKDISPKIKQGKYKIHDLQTVEEMEPLASYKDMVYRNYIASRYGIFLSINALDFCEPHLTGAKVAVPLLEQYRQRYMT
jgi:hypothetical protein